jgi:hypothetical protein
MATHYPEKFPSVIQDFIQDLSIPFPEYSYLWSKWEQSDVSESEWQNLYEYCLSVYPERFFDILYENEEVFSLETKTNTLFLPSVEFKLLYHCEGVTDNTRKSIWKYIQLILFTIVGNVKDKQDFGKSMNLFEGIDEKELQEKLTNAMSGIGDFFKNLDRTRAESGEPGNSSSEPGDSSMPDMGKMFEEMKSNPDMEKMFEEMKSNPDMGKMFEEMKSNPDIGKMFEGMKQDPNSKPEMNAFFDKMFGDMGGMKGMKEQFEEFQSKMGSDSSDRGSKGTNAGSGTTNAGTDRTPNPDDIHNHLKDLFGGKLGSLAKELVEELSEELKEGLGLDDLDMNSTSSDVFKKLMKHPDKFMQIVKKINQKFQEKMSRGDISKEDLMKEASEMLKKMKEMGGGNSKQMNEMFQNMAKSMGGQMPGKNVKVDTNAMDRMMKHQSTREKMLAKLEQKKQLQLMNSASNPLLHPTDKSNQLVYLPPGAELQERTMIPKPSVPYVEKDLDELVAEIEGTGAVNGTDIGSKPNVPKKKKTKSKK